MHEPKNDESNELFVQTSNKEFSLSFFLNIFSILKLYFKLL